MEPPVERGLRIRLDAPIGLITLVIGAIEREVHPADRRAEDAITAPVASVPPMAPISLGVVGSEVRVMILMIPPTASAP